MRECDEEIRAEHQAWLDVFSEAMTIFGKSREELNKPKYRRFFTLIERWAYFDRRRRRALKEAGHEDIEEHKGVFYHGEGKQYCPMRCPV